MQETTTNKGHQALQQSKRPEASTYPLPEHKLEQMHLSKLDTITSAKHIVTHSTSYLHPTALQPSPALPHYACGRAAEQTRNEILWLHLK